MLFLQKITNICHFIAHIFWNFLIIALPLCIFISASNAFVRKVLDLGSNAFLEIQWYLFSAIFLLGAGRVLKNDGHIRIDILYSKMNVKTQLIINIILHSILTLPVLVFLIILSIPFFLESIGLSQITLINILTHIINVQYHEVSPNAGGLSTWYAKLLLPLGFTTLLFAVVGDILQRIIDFQKIILSSKV